MNISDMNDDQLKAHAADLERQQQALMAEAAALKAKKAKVQAEREAVAQELALRAETAKLSAKFGRRVTIAPAGVASNEAFGQL